MKSRGEESERDTRVRSMEIYAGASTVGDNREIFRFTGVDCRLVMKTKYPDGAVFPCLIGTHAECHAVSVEGL